MAIKNDICEKIFEMEKNSQLISVYIDDIRNLKDMGDKVEYDMFVFRVRRDYQILSELMQYPRRVNGNFFVACAGGTAKFYAGTELVTLAPCDVYFNNSVSNIYELVESDNLEAYVMMFSNEVISLINQDIPSDVNIAAYFLTHPKIKLPSESLNEFDKSYELLKHTITVGGPFKDRAIVALFNYFAYLVCNLIHAEIQRNPNPSPFSYKSKNSYFPRFLLLLNQNVEQNRSVSFYSDKLHISSRYLSKIIKNATGQTANEYIDNAILMSAKSLLKYTTLNIQEISYKLNFVNPPFFSKFFKQHTGMTPKQYRNA